MMFSTLGASSETEMQDVNLQIKKKYRRKDVDIISMVSWLL